MSVILQTPNACNECHQDRPATWAAAQVAKWYGPNRRREQTYGEILRAGRRREPGAARGLQKLARDQTQPAIVRATALKVLTSYPSSLSIQMFVENLSHSDPLVRRSAVSGLELLPPEHRAAQIAPLLQDSVRAVRMEVALLLAGLEKELTPKDAAALRHAMSEYEAAQGENADQPGSHVNQANLHAIRGEFAPAQAAYEAALELDPESVPAYTNLADLKSERGLLAEAEQVLRAGLESVPDAAALHHALGLVLSRQGEPQQALAELGRAMQLAPGEPRFAYVYGVALYDLASPARGIALLRSALERFPNDRDLLLGLAAYARQEGDGAAADRYIARLRAIEE